ncbi:hypothetical protein COCMIDRAFT_7675 [Bipolaris oryzae ATCC 44560]|uniref:Uncharacterized protein n=1 Tax=Bipolaris oryzae ATCC 44560 TaxID=930090 RepID=W6YTI9_COCMI|nr:uncharacterized protein COCMIDRAFT_7675 [Bipolaris oryzae ATCC 44560]EUC42772.1 hypothetical protein COCMIDRAFT_7675 [Bipolaris oryzae ATCC 44560]
MGTANVKRRLDLPQPASHNNPSAPSADPSWMPKTPNAHAASRNMFPIAMTIHLSASGPRQVQTVPTASPRAMWQLIATAPTPKTPIAQQAQRHVTMKHTQKAKEKLATLKYL